MTFKVIFTHNPQDFFSGLEPYELCEVVRFESQDEIPAILDRVAEGYKAVIVIDGDGDG